MKKSKTTLVIGVATIIMAGIFIVIKLSSEPAEGVIRHLKPGENHRTEEKESQAAFDGEYVKFNYPNSYRKIAVQKHTNLEVINLLGSGTRSGEITVTVSKGSLDENSAVKLRRLQKQVYNEQVLDLPHMSGIVFIKQPPPVFEKTAVFERNSKVATIAISSNVGKDLSDVFATVAKDFQWK